MGWTPTGRRGRGRRGRGRGASPMPPGGRVFTSRDERVPGPAPGGTPILYTNDDAAVADEWAGQLLSGGEGV